MPIEKNTFPKNQNEDYTKKSENIRRIRLGVGAVALGVSVIAGTASAQNAETLNPSTMEPAKIKQKAIKERIRCERQKELDPRQFSSCQYESVYTTIKKKFPQWAKDHNLAKPGEEDKPDRKVVYFKTHPGEYKTMRIEARAGINYKSPRVQIWDYVNSTECGSAYHPGGYGDGPPYWNCDTGNGYQGGLQMDKQFQKTYNRAALIVWGEADNWPKEAQMLAADRAYDGYGGYRPRGLSPWPTASRNLGNYPDRVR